MSNQECWLIERFVNGHMEWFAGWANDAYGLNAGPSSVWVADAFKGVRFTRKQDALNIMSGHGERFHLAKAVSHLWFIE